MKLNGLKDILKFLNMLDKMNLFYFISHPRPETLKVHFTLVTLRVEIEFFEDHIEYSLFKGNEEVLDDQSDLFNLIKEWGE
jgi:hypothetical protein